LGQADAIQTGFLLFCYSPPFIKLLVGFKILKRRLSAGERYNPMLKMNKVA
jgi:hypothetical protein